MPHGVPHRRSGVVRWLSISLSFPVGSGLVMDLFAAKEPAIRDERTVLSREAHCAFVLPLDKHIKGGKTHFLHSGAALSPG